MRKIVLSLPLSGICDGRQPESVASGLHRLESTGFLRFSRVLYCSPKVKIMPADAAMLFWFSRLPVARLGKRVSM